MNNNNRDNNDGSNESLFWKVFSNVYLLNYIIKKIHTTEWVLYNDHKEIYVDTKMKFQHIFSIDWMIEKKLYSLIKCKIESGDFIQVDNETFVFTFKHLSRLTKRIEKPAPPKKKISTEIISIKDKKEIEYKKEIEDQNEIESLIGIIKLLMDKKRLQFEICDLTRVAVIYDCLDALKVLTSEPYSIIVYPSTLELAILKCHPSMVKHLLSLNQFNLVTDEIKYRSLNLASQNEIHYNEMVEFILDNPELYQVSTTTTTAFKYHILVKDFIKLKSIESKNKLMVLDIITNYDMYGVTFSISRDLNINQSFEEMLLLIKIHYKYIIKNGDVKGYIPIPLKNKISSINTKYDIDGNKESRLKEFIKLLIIEFKSTGLYNEFILKFKESIDEFQNDGLRSNDYDENINKFITLFRFISINQHPSSNQLLKKTIEIIKKQKLQYYPILNSIDIKTQVLNIENKELLDWLVKCDLEIINKFIQFLYVQPTKLVQFSTLGLWNYAIKINVKFTLNPNTIVDGLSKCYSKSIKECDIDTLVLLNSHPAIGMNGLLLDLPEDETKINKLIDHYNSNGYKSFSMPLFYQFFLKALSKVPSISFSNVVMDFSSFPLSIRDIYFISSILALDFRITEIFFNNFKHIIFTENQFTEFRNVEKNLFDSNKSMFYHYDYDENELISFCGKLMNKFNQREILQNENNNQIEIQSYQAIFNYYFQILIQIEFISLDKVYSVHKLLIDNSFEIQHTIFHSFYYLQIRNVKFIKYVLNRPGFAEFFFAHTESEDVFSGKTNYIDPYDTYKPNSNQFNGFNLSKYLNINQFTFDYILGTTQNNESERIFKHSFNEILNKLVMELSINLVSTEKLICYDFFNESINANLLYFLEIRRIDLFFKHLEYISSKLEESISSNEINGFPFKSQNFYSPSTELLPSSKLFENCNSKPKTYEMSNEKWKDSLIIPCSKFTYSFKFSEKVVNTAAILFNIQELQKFIEFNWNVNSFHDRLFKRSIWWGRYENASFILDNYNVNIFNFPMYPISLSFNYNYQDEFKIYNDRVSDPRMLAPNYEIDLFNTYSLIFINQLISYLSISKNQKDYDQFISIQQQQQQEQQQQEQQIQLQKSFIKELVENLHYIYFIKNDKDLETKNEEKKLKLVELISKNTEIQLLIKSTLDKFTESKLLTLENGNEEYFKNYIEDDNSIFIESFIFGDIIMCNLILNRYPSIFKITKQSIKKVIESDKIHIIKYFYNQDNCKLLINNFQSDSDLYNYLEEQLSIHLDYKFDLNWLIK